MRRILVASILLAIILSTSYSLFHPGFFRVHDFTHGARIAELARAVADGHVPPQWSKNLGFGYGMPLYLFYAPLPYYFGSLIYWLSGSLVLSIKSIFLLANVGTAIGAYLLGKRLFGTFGGLLVSAAITLAPYRAVNLFVRGAVSEAWGIMAAVWILYGVVLVLEKERRGWLVLTLSTVAMLLSHNLTAMIFAPFAALFALTYWFFTTQRNGRKKIEFTWKPAAILLGSVLLGAVISAYYLLPAFGEKSATQLETRVLTSYFDYHLHFLYLRQFVNPIWKYGGSVWGPEDDISFFLGFGQIVAAAITSLAVVHSLSRLWQHSSGNFIKFIKKLVSRKVFVISMSFVFLLIAVYFSLLKSLAVWDSLPILKYVQFPWRFLSIIIVFTGLISAGSLALIRSSAKRFVLWFVLITMMFANLHYFRPEKYLDSPEALYFSDPGRISDQMSGILPDYLPLALDEEVLPIRSLELTTLNLEDIHPEVLIDRTQEKLLKVDISEDKPALLQIADFPGWVVEIDGLPVEHATSEHGLIQVDLSEGQHLVGVRLGSTPIRRWGYLLTTAGLFVFFALLLNSEKKDKRAQ